MNQSKPESIYQLIKRRHEENPDAIAIIGIERDPLTYGRLHAHIEDTVKMLNEIGVGRSDRVAIVLPNGPDMAVAFLAVSAAATSAPLNPAYRAAEFDFYLSDLDAKALIIQSDMDSPAIDVAKSRNIPVIKLSPESEAGIFRITCKQRGQEIQGGFAQPDDVALVLHTSGTTSRPKMVPLTHKNICTSADNIRNTLNLTKEDRCLNVMPLFHIHGLIGATLSSISAGASIVCTPGFYAPRFFEWLGEFHPTWYTAVPTMHQAILSRAQDNRESIEQNPLQTFLQEKFDQKIKGEYSLRFIRSSSASLPPKVMSGLEKEFSAPVIESYGMTEASHQMTSNLLPPGQRKPGSVGIAAGPEVAIMDEEGNLLSHGETGEIVIRGANVTRGYENNPEANEKAFTNGWFRTGDQGYFDTDNYLFITGRLKEIINRGGEKISPKEVDEVLMDYIAVEQAVTFAVPHARLGEEVAVAVILKEKAFATERHIQEFAAERLAYFKVPRRVIILNEVPKGPTGKLQRIGLAEKLGLTEIYSEESVGKAKYIAPRNSLEETLVKVWEQVLSVNNIGIRDSFFDLGGDSMLAAKMSVQLQRNFGKDLPLTTLYQSPTIEQLATIIREESASPNKRAACSTSLSSLVAIQTSGSRPPFFCVHTCLGEVLNYFPLARHLGQDQPFYAFRSRGMYGEKSPHTRIQDMATDYIKEMRTIQPEGPYFIGGAGTGGKIALEMAHQLLAQNQEVGLLVIMEAIHFGEARIISSWLHDFRPERPRRHYIDRTIYHLKQGKLHRILWDIFRAVLKRRFGKYYWKFAYSPISRRINYIHRRINYIDHVRRLMVWTERSYTLRAYPGPIIYFLSETRKGRLNRKWYELAGGGLDVRVMPGHHTGMLQEPYVQTVAEELRKCLDKAQASSDD